ncbi:MAG: TonB-dependent receptor domain-containing protein [Fidelibacterota bacterium]
MILVAASFLPATETVSLRGKVVDQVSGKPVENANVILVGTELGDATDSDGRFDIEGVDPGRYRLRVTHIGYGEVEKGVDVPPSGEVVIALEETFFQLGEVVITGTRTRKIHRNVPVATEVISRKDIVDSGARDMAELLEERAGSFIHSSVAGGNILSLLGIDSKYILIMVDGQPVTGKFNDRVSLDQFSTVAVDKVEIVKGPSSSLYGSEALGGVVNIVTRKKRASAPLVVRTRFTGTDRNHNLFDGGQGKRDLRLNYSGGSGMMTYGIGLDLLKANVDQENRYINVDDYGKYSVRAMAEWTPTAAHTLSLNVDRFSNLENSHTRVLDATTAILRNSVRIGHNWEVAKRWRLDTIFRRDRYQRHHLQERPWGEKVEDNVSREKTLELEENLHFSDGDNTVTVGLELSQSAFSSERVEGGKKDLVTSGLFVQWDRRVGSHLDVILGSRVDANDEITPIVSPRVAAMVTLGTRWRFRAAWGKAFRLPSFMDRYIDWNHVQFGYRIVGNPRLRPESSRGVSLGAEYTHLQAYQVSLMVYRNRFRDMINDHLLEPGLFSYRNIDRVQYTAVELLNRWAISSRWVASWGYNYLDNRDLSTGELVANTQPHSANIRLSYTSTRGRVSASVNAKIVGPYTPEEYVPEQGKYVRSDEQREPFSVINVTGKVRVSHLFSVFFGVRNMTDYTDDRFGPFVGRSFYLELMTELTGGN